MCCQSLTLGLLNLHKLFTVAELMCLAVQQDGGVDVLNRRVLGEVLYEPSTRTSTSSIQQ